MKDSKNDSTPAVARFGRDRRERTTTSERVERRPDSRREGDDSEHSAYRPARRASYNPNFTEDNRPVGEERPRRTFGDKPRYGDKPRFGERSGYGDKPRYGEKPAYGDRPRDNDRPRYGERTGYGDKPRYGERGYGERPRYGERPAYGDRPHDSQRTGTGEGEKPRYGERPGYGSKPRYGEKSGFGDKPRYGERGDKPSYGDKPSFGRKPYGESKFGGERRSYGERKPYGAARPEEGTEEERPRRAYGDKPYAGKGPGRKFGDKPYGDKPYGKKSYGSRPADGERTRRQGQPGTDRPKSYPRYDAAKPIGEMRLNRYIAQSGICSRREADDFITAGLVSVNGTVVTQLGTKVMPTDEVKFNDSRVEGEKKVYLVLNKPKGYVTTLEDPHADKTVMELVKDACTERIYPVGRLDKNSLGLLLFTNDGDLTKQLTHPTYMKKKIYQVSLDKPLSRADMDAIAEGVTLEDGEIFADEIAYVKDNKQEVGIEIHSGRNRIVRRIFEHLGYEVKKLDRVYYAGLTKKRLKRGAWRFLTPEEVQRLKSGQYE